MAAVRAALRALRALGPREKVYAGFLASADSGFVAANDDSESFPAVKGRGARGYGLVCGPRPAREGDVVLRVPPRVWLPYCAEAAVRKAEAAAPDFVARLSHVCKAIGGGPSVATFSCLALEMLFVLERDNEPYLGRLWEASRWETALPHPLLMTPTQLDFLEASPLRDDISTAVKAYSSLHRALFNLDSENGIDGNGPTPVVPDQMCGSNPHTVKNLLRGRWVDSSEHATLPDPLNGEPFLKVPATDGTEAEAFAESLAECPRAGLHNPLKNPERYLTYGSVTAKAAALMANPEVEDFLARLIIRVAPKSYAQALGEVVVTRRFMENFSGDNVRFLARSFNVPGDHLGQVSTGYRWPYGPVAIVSPFNFPLEIPMLQMMGALYMGNKVVFKTDSKVSVVMEQTIRLLHHCGMPMEDMDFINCDGSVMHGLLMSARPRVTQFTGSSKVAEILAKELHGKVKIEDAGFDWKILGPDVRDEDYVAYTCDQDAYAYSGQKCSAQSILFVHENWTKAGLLDRLERLAARRNLDDLTVGPVLTVTTKACMDHIDKLLKISGAKVLFGGKPLSSEKAKKIPAVYGAWEPTAVFVPLSEMLKPENFGACTTEVFGPFQVVTEFADSELDMVLEACEGMENHLTAAVVSNDAYFQRRVLESTINGTTYCGIRARTTGAPQNHWFGPAGDPRAAGIGTIEAIRLVWSCHREVISDEGPVPDGWKTPAAT